MRSFTLKTTGTEKVVSDPILFDQFGSRKEESLGSKKEKTLSRPRIKVVYK